MDAPVSEVWRSIYRYVPGVMSRKRAALMDLRESTHDFVTNPSGAMGSMFSDMHKQMVRDQLPGREDLWEKLTPKYHLGCKRIIISDDYFPLFAQDNVVLETRPISHIEGRSVKVTDSSSSEPVSAEDDYDLLVCATGFQTVDFMHPIKMTGSNSKTLAETWASGAQALYGMTVENMPNFAMLYGPNTNLGHNSIILMIEAQSRYINGLIEPVLKARSKGSYLTLQPKLSVLQPYNDEIQKELQNSSFNDPNCNSWYKNDAGRITNNWSRTVVEYQKMVEDVSFDEFDVQGEKELVQGKKTHLGRVREESIISDRTLLMVMGVASTAAVVGGWALSNSRGLRVR